MTTLSTEDQHIRDFLEIKILLDELEERDTKSACISKLLGKIVDPDYAKYSRAVSRD